MKLSEFKRNGENSKIWGKKFEEYLDVDNNICIAEHPNEADIWESVQKNYEVDEVIDEENKVEESQWLLKSLHETWSKRLKQLDSDFNFKKMYQMTCSFSCKDVSYFWKNSKVLRRSSRNQGLFFSLKTSSSLIVHEHYSWCFLAPEYYVNFYAYFNNLNVF